MFVESPAKIKSISKYLSGRNLKVFATYGHIRELSKGWLNFGPDNFEIKWSNIERKISYENKKVSIIEAIKNEAKQASKIYLSTDPDREGEAIAWHIYSILGKEHQKKCSRAVFNEITESAVKYSLENTRQLDQAQINSYLARVLLDRWIGFNLSSYVRKKVGGQSAGRVQSIALKFLADRDEEIKSFQPKNWFILKVQLQVGLTITLFKLSEAAESQVVLSPHGKKGVVSFQKKEDLERIINDHLDDHYILEEIGEKKLETSSPPEVLKTSTLFELAINKLGLKAEDVRRVAQSLYEGINLGGETISLITYPRTDRSSVSEEFLKLVKKFILKEYGETYWVEEGTLKKKSIMGKKEIFIQGAHEGIRPTDVELTPQKLSKLLSTSSLEFQLYRLIWSYTVASFFPSSRNEKRRYVFENQGNFFYASESSEVFDGYKYILRENGLLESREKSEFDFKQLIKNNKYLSKEDIIMEERNSPPSKYSEATLIKALENKGIGRPSTYPLISEIVRTRNYANFKNKKFEITELGYKVSKDLDQNFSNFISYDYTRTMEEELDNISKLKTDWKKFLEGVFIAWNDSLKGAEKAEIVKDKSCPECGSQCVYKFSRKNHNKFIGCIDFPKCKFVENIEQPQKEVELLDKLCSECKSPLAKKKNRWGNEFISCSNYPKCKYIERNKQEYETVENSFCPECNSQLVYKNSKRKGNKFIACSGFPNCRYSSTLEGKRIESKGNSKSNKPPEKLDRKCPKCKKNYLQIKMSRKGTKFISCSGYPRCKYVEWMDKEGETENKSS
ncbi:type I DNA topoisomerase [Mycoplasma suis]|nr:type I DNA topoisomerase [Mycoplasma suis]